jgi:hypothetical protein
MPFKSQAQRRKFAELLVKGEISPATFEEWNRETGSTELPERVTPKQPKKTAAVKTRKKAPAAAVKKSSRRSGRKPARKRSK